MSAKEQIQEDIMSILDEFGIKEAMTSQGYNEILDSLCDSVVRNINKSNPNESDMRNAYILVYWPESQDYMDEPWFDDEAVPGDQSSSFFIPVNRVWNNEEK
jgi:hypothetical protein